MSVPTYATIIEKLFTELDGILHNYVYNGYNALAHALKYPLGTAIALYIVLLGISISQGWVKLSMDNFVKSTLKIGLIYTFAMNWSFFSDYVVKLIQGGAGELGDILVSATPINLPHFAGTGINGALQTVLIEFTKIGVWVWDMGSWHNISPYFTAGLIFAFSYAMIFIGAVQIAFAQIMMSILFTTAPLFVCFTLFKSTHGFFDRWLGALVGFSLLLIFISAVLALALSVAQWAIGDSFVNRAVNINLVGFIPTVLVCFLGIVIISRISELAQSIGGAVSTASSSSLLAGAIGGAISGTLSTMRLSGSALSSMGKLFKPAASKNNNNGSANMKAIRERLRRGK